MSADELPETVWVTPVAMSRKRNEVFHLSPECERLKGRVREVASDHLFDNARLCQWCDGTQARGGGDRNLYLALSNPDVTSVDELFADE